MLKETKQEQSEDERMALAERVKKALERLPRGGKKILAERCNISPQAITGWVKTGRIDKSNLIVLSELTTYRLEWLITGKGLSHKVSAILPIDDMKYDFESTDKQRTDIKKTENQLTPISQDIEPGPNRVGIKHVSFRLQAGVSGFAFDPIDDDDPQLIYFNKSWLSKHRYQADKLLACTVRGDSMCPRINDGDLIVVNTDQQQPKDGVVFAINYEGELVVKRMKRDAGLWYLSSDNPDKTKYPDKLCAGDFCLVIGECVYLQTSII